MCSKPFLFLDVKILKRPPFTQIFQVKIRVAQTTADAAICVCLVTARERELFPVHVRGI